MVGYEIQNEILPKKMYGLPLKEESPREQTKQEVTPVAKQSERWEYGIREEKLKDRIMWRGLVNTKEGLWEQDSGMDTPCQVMLY